MSKSKPHENPLVPNKKLRQLYALMSQARALDEFAVKTASSAKAAFPSTHGEEACRASTAVNLASGDLISDTHESAVMDLIAGRNVRSLLRRLDAIVSGKNPRRATHPQTGAAQLPWTKDTATRLTMALGAAASIKATGQPSLVMAYAHSRDLPDAGWRSILKSAAQFELPIIFVVLPGHRGAGSNLCALTQKLGLPGFPVDAADAVALYRVAQESIGRARGDRSPVLIECHRTTQDDALAQMRSFLLSRGVAGKAWMSGIAPAFRRQLEAARRASRHRIQRESR